MTRDFRLTPAVFGCVALFVGISILVASGVTIPWDDATLAWVGSIRSAWLTEVMLAATFLGDGSVEVPLALGACVLLWRRAGGRAAMALFLGGLTGQLVYVAAKASFQRPRPLVIEQLSGAGWYSYPSGHAMLAPILWSLGLILLARTAPSGRRWPFLVLAVVIPVAIAISRVYLGVHYPSDVLGALALGLAWMFLWLDWSRASPTSRSASTM